MERLRIIVLATLAAVGYGIVHDQVTARICVEYFTIGHPFLLDTDSPTLLALAWGVVATWWVGLPLGFILSLAARQGSRPKLTAAQLRRPIVVLLLGMGACAAMAGVLGGILAARGAIWLAQPLASMVGPSRQLPFLVDLWMHSASYAAGALGGLGLAAWTWRQRGTSPSSGSAAPSPVPWPSTSRGDGTRTRSSTRSPRHPDVLPWRAS